jgi:thymidylate kinase
MDVASVASFDTSFLESRAADVLTRFDPERVRRALSERPFMLELFGTPKSGKSTMKEMLKHFFKRNGLSVSTPTEGAEAVEWIKRREPDYNFQTAEYALSLARERAYGPGHRDFHVVIFDRAIFDCIARMEYYVATGKISESGRKAVEGYYLLPQNKNLFDLHVCLVADPEVAIRRELARALTKKPGETMNADVLRGLLDAHTRVWNRFTCDNDPSMLWHDSSSEREEETALSILATTLEAFTRRLDATAKK